MRIWSLHPRYLDAKGLVALWREALLAKHVLLGKTRGYTNHPQLDRFKASKDPVSGINYYLSEVYLEAERRGYSFDRRKINWRFRKTKMRVTDGQMAYELKHLKRKLRMRDPKKLSENPASKLLKPHPLFRVVRGGIEAWEVVSP